MAARREDSIAISVPTHNGRPQPKGAIFFAKRDPSVGELLTAESSAFGPGSEKSPLASCFGSVVGLVAGAFLLLILGQLLSDLLPFGRASFVRGFLVLILPLLGGVAGALAGRSLGGRSRDYVSYIGKNGLMIAERVGTGGVAEKMVVLFEEVKYVRLHTYTFYTYMFGGGKVKYVRGLPADKHVDPDSSWKVDWGIGLLDAEALPLLTGSKLALFEKVVAASPAFAWKCASVLSDRHMVEAALTRAQGKPVSFPVLSNAEQVGAITIGSQEISWQTPGELTKVNWSEVESLEEEDGRLTLACSDGSKRSVDMFDVGNLLVLLSLSRVRLKES